MKKVLIYATSLAAVGALGFASIGLATSSRAENFAPVTITCGKAISVSPTQFPNNNVTNTIYVTIKSGSSTVNQTISFKGSSPNPSPWLSSVVAQANTTYTVTTAWNGNGVKGGEPTTQTTGSCSTTTTTTTTTHTTTTTPTTPVTTTVLTTTTMPAPPAVTTTQTVTTPAPPAPPAPRITCHNGSVQTGAYTCEKTIVKKCPKPKPLVCPAGTKKMSGYCLKVVKRTVTVTITVKQKLTVAEKCVSVPGNMWVYGKCGGIGRG